MNQFIKEFKENIPYIADELASGFAGGSDSWTIQEAYEKADQVLRDWLNEYQSDLNNIEEVDMCDEFYNEQFG